jgi:PAS domain S-box-containing protein
MFMPEKQRVSAAELVRNFGFWQEKALHSPVYITHHKRDRLVLSSVERFQEISNVHSGPAFAAAGSIAFQRALPAQASQTTAELWALLDNVLDIYMVFDAEFRVLSANYAAEAFTGLDRTQLIGRHLNDTFPSRAAAVTSEHIARTIRTRQGAAFEMESSLFAGRHFMVRLFPHRHGVAMLCHNVTELHHLRKLVQEADSLRSALDRHPQIARAQTDARGRITYSDDTLRLWTGFSQQELETCGLSDIVVVADRRRINQTFEDVMMSHVPTVAPFRVMGKNFAEHDILVALAPIMSDFAARARASSPPGESPAA